MKFNAPEYTCRHPIFPTWSNIDKMYEQINLNECDKSDFYEYLSFVSNSDYHATFDGMHGG